MYDYDTENYVDFDQDASVIQGKDIDIYNYSDESRHTVHVISVSTNRTEVEIEVYDYDKHDYRTFEMDVDTDNQQKTAELA